MSRFLCEISQGWKKYEYEHEYEYKTGREKIEEVDEKEEQNENSHRFLFDKWHQTVCHFR